MRSRLLARVAGSAIAALMVFSLAIPAKADNALQRITISVAPVYLFSTNGDANAYPPPPDSLAGIGYTRDNPTVSTARIDYGADLKITSKLDLSYSHGNVGYQLGRILTIAPNTAFVSGSIYDYTDTIGLNYAVGHGLTVHGTYFNHQRSDVTGLCLNQKSCPDPVTGVQQPNPVSIDEHGYTLGAGYDFGPMTKVGSLLNAAFDIKYVPRPSSPTSPTVALGGLGHWVGSQTLFPYSLTLRLPITGTSTLIPFVNYTHLPVLYRDSAVPEDYRGMIFGVSDVLSKNVTLSYTNFNLQTCRCIARVPPPDNLRLTFGIVKLDLHTSL